MIEVKRKPAGVQAIRFSEMDGEVPIFETLPPQWLLDAMQEPPGEVGAVWEDGLGLTVGGPRGDHAANKGDYIVRESDGSLMVCSPEAFAAQFETA